MSPFPHKGGRKRASAITLRAIVAPTAAILTQRHKMFTRAPGAKLATAGFM